MLPSLLLEESKGSDGSIEAFYIDHFIGVVVVLFIGLTVSLAIFVTER